MQITPYMNFNGRAEEAIEFYKSKLGAQVQMSMRHSDSPDPPPPGMITPGTENKIMHASIKIGDSVLHLSDGRCTGATKFEGITLSLAVGSVPEAERVYAALADGGQAQMLLMETFFAQRWGMVADRFGVSWMVIVMK
jgi:PhnB protein